MTTPYDSCTLDSCPITYSIFYYRPSLAANVTFLALFAFTGLLHLAQGTYSRKPWFAATVCVGCITEILGYVGRIISWRNPFSVNGFLIQVCCITIAPAFFTAAIYVCLGDIVRHTSVTASRLPPRGYAWIFVPCDIVSLVLQGAGGGLASVAAEQSVSTRTGSWVMVAGLAFQVFSMAVFICLVCDYVHRVRKLQRNRCTAKPPLWYRRGAIFAFFFSFAIVCIFIRCIYRVVELSGGWQGNLVHDQTDFIVLEGM